MTSKKSTNSLPCDAGQLIPHQPPMRLVDRLIEKTEGNGEDSTSVVEAVVPRNGPFVDNGTVLPEYAIEVMAQAIAASDGFPVVEDAIPATGLLTGIDSFSWLADITPGSSIRITVRKIFEFGSAFIFTGFLTAGEKKLAEGKLKIWRVEQ